MRQIVFFFLFFLSFTLFSQPIQAEVTVTEKKVLLGDLIHLQLNVQYSPDYNIQVADFKDSTGKFEVLQHPKPVQGIMGKLSSWNESYQLTCFDSGNWLIPAFTIRYQKKGENTWQSTQTQALSILVQTVAVDTTKEIKPIKALVETTYQWQESIPYLVVFLLVLIAVLSILFVLRRKKNKLKPAAPPAPPRLLVEIVHEKLDNLAKKGILENGNYKLYYTELTDILRFYIEKRYQISTFEATTDEILAMLQQKVEKHHLYSLQGILQTADLVKFAKLIPENENHTYQMEMAKKWVSATDNQIKISL